MRQSKLENMCSFQSRACLMNNVSNTFSSKFVRENHGIFVQGTLRWVLQLFKHRERHSVIGCKYLRATDATKGES